MQELSQKKKGTISCGMFVTKIAKSIYPNFSDELLEAFDVPKPLNFDSLNKLEICIKKQGVFVLKPEKKKGVAGLTTRNRQYQTKATAAGTAANPTTPIRNPILTDLTMPEEEKQRRINTMASMSMNELLLLVFQQQEQIAELQAAVKSLHQAQQTAASPEPSRKRTERVEVHNESVDEDEDNNTGGEEDSEEEDSHDEEGDEVDSPASPST